MAWLEISLTVDGELAEAVAEVLSRYIPEGVVIESTQVTDAPAAGAHPYTGGRSTGPLRVCGYLPVDENLETNRQKIAEGLWYLGRIHPLPPATFKPLQAANWMESWKANYKPIPVGERLLILPAWLPAPDTARTPIRIDPGMAFGTGTHPTTQLCLQLLEDWLPAGEPIIDIGCGSGILSIAALKLGARAALGVDIDAEALANARKNAEANGVAETIEFGIGSVGEIKSGRFSRSSAPLVLANILAKTLLRLLDEGLSELVAPGGTLLLSGILDTQEAEMMATLKKHTLHVRARQQMGDWVALAVSS